MLKNKSLFSPVEPAKDGLRILAARFRGRGLPASRYDVWMANLGPSETLLRAFQSGRITWTEFGRQYRREIFLNGPIDTRSRSLKNHGQKFTLRLLKHLARRHNITLLCHCDEDQKHCHRHLLQKLILSNAV